MRLDFAGMVGSVAHVIHRLKSLAVAGISNDNQGDWRVHKTKMLLADLEQSEREIVKECLRAAAEGPFFPDWEFDTLFGLERDDLKSVLNSWPEIDENNESVRLAINNSLNNLLGYPLGEANDEWSSFISVSKEEVGRIFSKWRGEKIRDYFTGLR